MDVKDQVKDHVIEMAVILPQDLNITDVAHPPPPMGHRGDHRLHMALHAVHTASWSGDEAYPQEVVEMKVIDRVPLEKVVMGWDENLFLGEVDIQHPSMNVDARWIADEEAHPLPDSMQNVGEVLLE